MDEETISKLEKVRMQTGAAISAMAQAKHELESIRKDVLARPERIQQAALAYRQSEQVMNDMVKLEINTIIEVATGSSKLRDRLPD